MNGTDLPGQAGKNIRDGRWGMRKSHEGFTLLLIVLCGFLAVGTVYAGRGSALSMREEGTDHRNGVGRLR
jgi:hypothetical protein